MRGGLPTRAPSGGPRQPTGNSAAIRIAAVCVLVLGLGAGATYWHLFGKQGASAPAKRSRPDPEEAFEALAEENRNLRAKAEELQGELDDAQEALQKLQEKLEQRERREEPALRNLPSPAPEAIVSSRQPEARSGMDLEEEKATFLVPGFERLSRGVGSLSALEDQYQQACTGTMPVSATDGFGNQVGGSINRADTPECMARASSITDLRAQLKTEASRIEEAARRAGILPGVLRGLVARYRVGDYLNP